jgi:hypothetical protein
MNLRMESYSQLPFFFIENIVEWYVAEGIIFEPTKAASAVRNSMLSSALSLTGLTCHCSERIKDKELAPVLITLSPTKLEA